MYSYLVAEAVPLGRSDRDPHYARPARREPSGPLAFEILRVQLTEYSFRFTFPSEGYGFLGCQLPLFNPLQFPCGIS